MVGGNYHLNAFIFSMKKEARSLAESEDEGGGVEAGKEKWKAVIRVGK